MKNNSGYFALLILLATVINYTLASDENNTKNSNPYFPVNNKITLIYKSSFGESVTRYYEDGEFTVSSSNADNFKYRQTMIIKENGVYVNETYQFMKILLFIKKEATFTYEKPLLRFPLPLVKGMSWKWEGEEYSDGDTNRVKVTGKVIDKEFINTKAGRFEALKLESVIEGTGNAKNRVTEWLVEGIGLIKAKIIIEGGGLMGFVRDLLGYGTIEFELTEIRKQ